jgi:hypothetical protein
MNTKPLVIICIFLILLAGNIVLGWLYFNARNELAQAKNAIAARQTNEKIADFAGLVVDKVLKAQGEVSFDDRLKLENAVRDTKDAELLAQWNKFTASQNETDAQNEMKNLISLLVVKMREL